MSVLRAGATKIELVGDRSFHGLTYWEGCLRDPNGKIVWQCEHSGHRRHEDRGMALKCSRKLVRVIAGHALEVQP